MSMPGTSIKVDLLLHSLKEIQQEKNCLDNKLQERRNKRRELEQTMEMVKGKLQQVQDVHTKMLETLKVAQYKAAQMQEISDNLEDSNLSKRKLIDHLQKKITDTKEEQVQQIKVFEDELADLSNKLISARNTYNDGNLKMELENACKNGLIIQQKEAVDGLELDFDRLKVARQRDIQEDDGIPLDIRKTLWSMFNDENAAAHSYLKSCQLQLDTARQRIQQA